MEITPEIEFSQIHTVSRACYFNLLEVKFIFNSKKDLYTTLSLKGRKIYILWKKRENFTEIHGNILQIEIGLALLGNNMKIGNQTACEF